MRCVFFIQIDQHGNELRDGWRWETQKEAEGTFGLGIDGCNTYNKWMSTYTNMQVRKIGKIMENIKFFGSGMD